MMRTTAKGVVLGLLLLLGFGAQSAPACVHGEAGEPVRSVAFDSSPTAVDFDRVLHERHCDCPARAEAAPAAVTASGKFTCVASLDGSAASPDASFAELRRALDAQSRFHSDAAPASHLPPYLLSARLRC